MQCARGSATATPSTSAARLCYRDALQWCFIDNPRHVVRAIRSARSGPSSSGTRGLARAPPAVRTTVLPRTRCAPGSATAHARGIGSANIGERDDVVKLSRAASQRHGVRWIFSAGRHAQPVAARFCNGMVSSDTSLTIGGTSFVPSGELGPRLDGVEGRAQHRCRLTSIT
jgi:hypothetical protein